MPWPAAHTGAMSVSSTINADRNGLPSPITQAVPISGCALSLDSRFAGEMFLPAALMISSFLRSTIFR